MIPIEWPEEGRKELIVAYLKAQTEMGAVIRHSVNPAFKSKYADLSSVLEAVLPALNKNGLVLIQSPSFDGEVLTVETIIAHTGGGYLRSALSMRPSKMDAHGLGSAETYARRYALLALAGVAPEDDDGNAASGPQEPAQRFRSGLERKTSAQAKRDGDHTEITRELAACQTEAALDVWFANIEERTRMLPLSWDEAIRDEVEKRRNELLDLMAERVG